MAIQTATTGNLAEAQRVVIAAVRFTEEHDAPAMALTTQMRLNKGEKQVTVPKVGQMTIHDLVDGQDIVDTEEIGMTTVDLTAAETGAKVILTDKLLRQSQPDVWRMVGTQLGDANARKKDTDVISLYPDLNGGTTLGEAGKFLTVANYAGAIAFAKGRTPPFRPTYAVVHPHTAYQFTKSLTPIGALTTNFPEGMMRDRLENFWTRTSFNGVALFQDGNIPVDSSDDAVGVLAGKDALVTLTAKATGTERQRDASLRAWELVMVSDYGVFVLDGDHGAPLTYDADVPASNA